MRTRRAIVASGLLGAAVLIPVLVIVILGAYGTALGGSTSTTGASGAQLTLMPSGGLPGELVTIQGRGWPARTEIVLFLSHDGGERPDSVRVRLGTIETSRSGTFEMLTAVPRRLVAPGTARVFFHAEAEDRDGVEHDVQPVPFELEPYPNSLNVEVLNAENATPMADVMVEVRDVFGQLVAAVKTGPAGHAEVEGVVPGTHTVRAMRIDYTLSEAKDVVVEPDGIAEVILSLRHAPGGRLYGLAYEREATGQPVLAGIDRASGLVVEDLLAVRPGRRGPVTDVTFGVFYDFVFATGDGATTTSLLALGSAGRMAMAYSAGNPTITRYAGESATGTVALTTAVGLFAGQSTAVVTLDRTSGEVIYRREVPTSSLTPVISADGTRLYVGDWLTGSVRVLDAATGDTLERHPDVVAAVRQIVADERDRVFVLEDQTGAVRLMDPVTGEAGDPLLAVAGMHGMAMTGEGNLVLFSPTRTDLIVANPETGELLKVVPLQTPAGFVWSDPDGPFLIVGYREDRRHLTLQVLDGRSYETVRIVELPLE